MEQRIPARGEIDIATAPGLRRSLEEAIEAHPGGSVVVDFSEVGFVDSSGLDMLVAAQLRARSAGGWLFLVDPVPPVQRVLRYSGLDELLLSPVPVPVPVPFG